MPDLIDEIKEDIKQENLEKLWKKYGNLVIGGVITVILATAGAVWWKGSKTAENEKYGSAIYEAYLNENKSADESIKTYSELLEQEGYGNVYIAALRKAALLVDKGDVEQANAVYKELSASKDVPVEVTELAEILYMQNSLDEKKEGHKKRLQEISDGSGAFKYSAKEMLAFLEFEAGNFEAAKKLFEELKADMYTPVRMRDRSGEMIRTIEARKDV